MKYPLFDSNLASCFLTPGPTDDDIKLTLARAQAPINLYSGMLGKYGECKTAAWRSVVSSESCLEYKTSRNGVVITL